MFAFLKKSITAAEFAKVMWDSCSEWPAKHGDSFKEKYHFEEDINEVSEEFVYYLSFVTDYAFYCQLEDKPQLEKAIRNAFSIHLSRYVREHNCKPIPSGEWFGDTLIWMQTGTVPAEIGNPLENMKRRSALYAQSLERRNDRSSGERTAHLLASWCGCSRDAIFILQVLPFFLNQWNLVKSGLNSHNIKI